MVDTEGKPVADASVIAEISTRAQAQSALTEEDGTFVLYGLASGDQIAVSAREDFASKEEMRSYTSEPLTVKEDGLHNLEIIVHKLSSISGKVVDPAGNSLEDVYIIAVPKGFLITPPSNMTIGYASSSSKKDGTFRIDRIFAGTWIVGIADTESQQEVVTLPGEETANVDFTFTGTPPEPIKTALTGSMVLSGLVSASDGKPLAGIHVTAHGEDDKLIFAGGDATTDKNGIFLIEGLPEGSYRLSAHDSDYYGAPPLEGIKTGTRNASIQLTRRERIEGRVVHATTNTPIGDFALGQMSDKVLKNSGLNWPIMRRLRALVKMQSMYDPVGKFLLQRGAAGDTYILVTAEGCAPEYVQVPEPRQDASPITVELKPEARVSGMVVSNDNKPIEGAQIYDSPIIASEQVEPFRMSPVAQSDANGSFTVAGLPDGPLTLSAYHANHGFASADVTLTAGETTPVTVTLSGGATLKGTVRCGGQPVAGQRVRVMEGNGITVTAPDGSYQILGLPPANVEVIAFLKTPTISFDGSEGSRMLRKVVALKDKSTIVVDFNFVPADAAIEGSISLDGQMPEQAGAHVKVVTPTGNEEFFRIAPLEEESDFQFDSLPSGQATFTAYAIRGETKRTSESMLTLEPGKTHSLNINFTGAGIVQGSVSGLMPGEQSVLYVYSNNQVSPEELSKMLTTLNSLKGNADASTIVSGDGSYHVEGLAPGDYTVVALAVDTMKSKEEQLDSLRHAIAPLTIAGQQTIELQIALK
ncbi:MAG: carboxypeptidase-like regulatory domain-containing protein [Candidatus Hydrogenedentales bacterium]